MKKKELILILFLIAVFVYISRDHFSLSPTDMFFDGIWIFIIVLALIGVAIKYSTRSF
jgi:hypothetical protein